MKFYRNVKYYLLGAVVPRAVAFVTKDSQFESSHRQILNLSYCIETISF